MAKSASHPGTRPLAWIVHPNPPAFHHTTVAQWASTVPCAPTSVHFACHNIRAALFQRIMLCPNLLAGKAQLRQPGTKGPAQNFADASDAWMRPAPHSLDLFLTCSCHKCESLSQPGAPQRPHFHPFPPLSLWRPALASEMADPPPAGSLVFCPSLKRGKADAEARRHRSRNLS
jgi:hypothetical protein